MTPPFPLKLIDTTLREGEQCALANFTYADKVALCEALIDLGLDYIELPNPFASATALEDNRRLLKKFSGSKTQFLAHLRCHPDDIACAMELPLAGVNITIALDGHRAALSHGLSPQEALNRAKDLLQDLRHSRPAWQLRFSSEGLLNSQVGDSLAAYKELDGLKLVDCIGVSDTRGDADPFQVHTVVSHLRKDLSCELEFHGHNDTGCAVANAYAALKAGANRIDVSLLGIGERNGITGLEGFLARLLVSDWAELAKGYNLPALPGACRTLTDRLGIEAPFNTPVVGQTAFSHKAGIHTSAVLKDPALYESIAPETFGLTRQLLAGHHLTGRHVVADRARALGLSLSGDQAREAARRVKDASAHRALDTEELDSLLRQLAEPETGPGTETQD
ncbi:homocitrate synthase/isopropylmalate synthase family protein [Rhodovibrionaceae bacterium A322]